jgi:hypothetical protein
VHNHSNLFPSRIYKIPDGKPANTFAFSGEAKNKEYATGIVQECNAAWRRLISGETPAKTSDYEISMYVLAHVFVLCFNELILYVPLFSANVTQPNSPGYVSKEDPLHANIPRDSRKSPAPIDPSSK